MTKSPVNTKGRNVSLAHDNLRRYSYITNSTSGRITKPLILTLG